MTGMLRVLGCVTFVCVDKAWIGKTCGFERIEFLYFFPLPDLYTVPFWKWFEECYPTPNVCVCSRMHTTYIN